MPEPLSFNPMDPATRLDPYPTYARARAESPALDQSAFGVVSLFRYDDVQALLRDPSSWSSVFPQQAVDPEEKFGPPSMIGVDPPEHTRLRSLVSQAFTPRIIGRLEPRMRELARDHVEKAVQAGSADLVESLTYPFPVTIIAEIIGVPAEDRAQFKQWSDESVANLGVGLLGAPPDSKMIESAVARRAAMDGYFTELAEERRRNPQPDLLSGLVQAEVDGSKLSFDEMMAMLVLILVAGNETTTTLIGNTVLTLLDHPEALETLRARPELIPSAIEEVLRFSSPVQVDPRCATRDTEVRGVPVKQGQIALGWIGSANRDESVYEDPERFDIERSPNRHLAFGFGTHYCLGANLARLEAQIALEALLEGTTSFQLANDQPLPLHPSFVFRSFTKIPLVFQA